MTHSSRRSYKDKYLALKDNSLDVSKEVAALAEAAEFQSLVEYQRQQQHEKLQELAKEVMETVRLLDGNSSRLGFRFKDVSRPTDQNLDKYDATLIIRRSRDVVRYANERIAIAASLIEDYRDSLNSVRTGTQLLLPEISKAQRGYLESYEIGQNPQAAEVQEAQNNRGKNPRLNGYIYETDDDNSVSDLEQEDERSDSAMSQLVVASPKRPKRRNARDTSIEIT